MDTVVLKHPTLALELVVTAEMAAMLMRLNLGYTEVKEEPADEPLEVIQTREGQANGSTGTND